MISFAEPAIQQCPFGAYEKLRRESPVYHDPVTGNFVLTRYEDVRKTLLNTRIFSSRNGLGGTRSIPETDAIFDSRGWRPMDTLISNDPPEHRHYRTLVDKAFAPARVKNMEGAIAAMVENLIDDFIDRSEVEFVAEFAIKLPMIIIAAQLSVAASDMDRFKLWSDISVESMDPAMSKERQIEVVTELTNMQQYMAAAIERLTAQPDDSLLSHLIQAEVDGERLGMGALQNIVQQLLVAGNETTTMALAAGIKMMIDRPELVEEMRADPGLIPRFVEEVLRIMAPVQTLFRKVTEDTEIGGVAIPAGSMVEVRFGAANLDPAIYERPDELDLHRTGRSAHMSFGAGPHLCIGNQLARGELRIAFEAIMRRMDNLRPSRGEESFAYTPLYISHGLTRLWLAFDKR
ncbi:cytochrome P450 [Sphingobium sp. AN558]|uniref:cytochrome P450 n=1 Tax=Sphingobium sp. AN558 TaxID=3133442 RepID=UPI0030BEB47B